MANKNAFDLATLVYQAAIIAPGKALVTKPANGTGDLSFSRAGSADRINAEGNTETMGPNTLRIDYRFSLDGSNTCPVALVTADDSETLSISNLVANGFTFDNCTVFYLDNFQRVVKVYTSDGNCKTFIDGEEIGTTVEARPDSLSFPIGNYSALQQLLIIKAALVDADALALSANALLDTYSQVYLSAYVQLLIEGYSIESAARTLAWGPQVLTLFSAGFRAFLAPGEGKATKVSFLKFTENAGNPLLPAELIEATYSCPNVGATSGVMGYKAGGELKEMPENVPLWHYPHAGGGVRLRLLSQGYNYVDNQDVATWTLRPVSNLPVVTGGQLAPDGSSTAYLVTNMIVPGGNIVNNSCVWNVAIIEPLDGEYVTGVWLAAVSGSGTISILNRGTSVGGSDFSHKQVTLTEDWQFFQFSKSYSLGESASNLMYGIIRDTEDTLTQVKVWRSDTRKGVPGIDFYINTTTAALTRSTGQLNVVDLVANGFTDGSGSFSLYWEINLETLQQSGNEVAAYFRNSGSNLVRVDTYPDNGIRFFDQANSTLLTDILATGSGVKKFVITFDGSTGVFKIYEGDSLRGTSADLGVGIDNVLAFGAPKGVYGFNAWGFSFAPVVLNEAQALAVLGS